MINPNNQCGKYCKRRLGALDKSVGFIRHNCSRVIGTCEQVPTRCRLKPLQSWENSKVLDIKKLPDSRAYHLADGIYFDGKNDFYLPFQEKT